MARWSGVRTARIDSCRACKPNSVCRSFSSPASWAEAAKTKSGTTVIPLGRALLRGSSDLPGSCDAPSRHVHPPRRTLLPYLVLLRVGFSLPPSLLTARCALTAPFHPYLAVVLSPQSVAADSQRRRGGMFSVALSVERSHPYRRGCPPGRYPAHCSAEFGLSSASRERSSGPAANPFIIVQRLAHRVSAGSAHTTSLGARKNV